MKKVNIKNIALSIPVIILVLMTTATATFSWIDDVKMVQFENDDLSDGAPLKTGVDINASINITSTNNTINLGNILTDSDTTYEYTEDGTTKKHVRYDGTVPASKPVWTSPTNSTDPTDSIDRKKGYFYESGDMHLSPCLSDGDTFYFPVGSNTYREGNKDDENVNYISFTAKVSSPDANVDFWFKQLPTITGKNASGGTVNVSNYARYAIIVDGQTHVYSSTGSARTGTSTLSGNIPVGGVRKTAEYTYGNAANTNGRGANGNTLFSIKKGATVKMTIKIWLESGFDSSVTTSDINLQLVSSWAYSRRIWIDDKTTNGGGGSWLDDGSAKLFVTFPVFLNELSTTVSDWPNLAITDNAPFFPVQTSNNKYYVEVPLVYNNEKMILYRCSNNGWNMAGSDAAKRSEYNVYCWNWWQTYTPNTYKEETYTLYGGSMDSTAYGYFNSINQGFTITNKGYGTWGSVEEIKVFSHYNNGDLASKGDGKAMYVVDHSDEDTSGETYIYEMYRSGTTSSDPWKTYVPAGSAKIQFRYFGGTSGLSWGYTSWNGENRQRRPLASTGLYPYNATEYQLAAIFDNVNGWGYWRDTHNNTYDKVYFVKKGSTFAYASNMYDYMYDNNNPPHYNSEWNASQSKYGYKMTRMKNASNQDVNWNDGSSWVMQSDSARPGSNIFNHLIFNDGSSGHQTNNLTVFPGCFYNPDDGKWYGAINDNGREASSGSGDSGGGGGSSEHGTDQTGGSMSGYNDSTGFVFNVNGNDYYVKTNGTDFRVRISLSTTGNHVTYVKNGSTNYKNGANYTNYLVKSGINLFLSAQDSGHNNDFGISNTSTGNFIVYFQYDNGNQNTIKITDILKEA